MVDSPTAPDSFERRLERFLVGQFAGHRGATVILDPYEVAKQPLAAGTVIAEAAVLGLRVVVARETRETVEEAEVA